MLFTIDPYYDIPFFNRQLESLKNNNIKYDLFIDNKAPHHYFIDQPIAPVFLDYDLLNQSRERNLVSIVQPLQPNTKYKYIRRPSITGQNQLNYYTLNDCFGDMQKSKQAVIFHQNPEYVFQISKKYPRKIYLIGRYFGNRYTLFGTDSLLIKNYLQDVPHKIMAERSSFQHQTELEQDINYKIFALKDRIIKLDETPYVLNGKFYQPTVQNSTVRNKFIIESDEDITLDYMSKEELLLLKGSIEKQLKMNEENE